MDDDEDVPDFDYLFGQPGDSDDRYGGRLDDDSEEDILDDPKDLFDSDSEENSEPEEDDISLDDKPYVRRSEFFDDEAEEDSEADRFDHDGSGRSGRGPRNGDSEGSDDDDSDESEEDKSGPGPKAIISRPLRQREFEDGEAVEHNNLKELYSGWTGSGSEADEDSNDLERHLLGEVLDDDYLDGLMSEDDSEESIEAKFSSDNEDDTSDSDADDGEPYRPSSKNHKRKTISIESDEDDPDVDSDVEPARKKPKKNKRISDSDDEAQLSASLANGTIPEKSTPMGVPKLSPTKNTVQTSPVKTVTAAELTKSNKQSNPEQSVLSISKDKPTKMSTQSLGKSKSPEQKALKSSPTKSSAKKVTFAPEPVKERVPQVALPLENGKSSVQEQNVHQSKSFAAEHTEKESEMDKMDIAENGIKDVIVKPMKKKKKKLSAEKMIPSQVKFIKRDSTDQTVPVASVSDIELCSKFDIFVDIKESAYKNMCAFLKKKKKPTNLLQAADELLALLKKALDARVIAAEQLSDLNRIRFGLRLNMDHANESLIKGPSGDSPEAIDFRHFWGPLAELRRFQDASICESVLIESKTFCDRREITGKIIRHIFGLHAGLNDVDIHVSGGQIRTLLGDPTRPEYGTGEEAQLAAIAAYDGLVKKLRQLTSELPLGISGHQGASAVFRGTEVFPPIGQAVQLDWDVLGRSSKKVIFTKKELKKGIPLYKPFEVIVHLESSGKWPEHLPALRRVKSAMVVAIDHQLTTKYALPTKVSPDYLDVFVDGFVFRLRVAVRKELTLLRRLRTSESFVKNVQSDEADQLEEQTELFTRLSAALNGLNQQNPTFGATSRVAKRWVASQNLSCYITDTVIELLVAHLFLNPRPFASSPNSPITGLVRFLNFISVHDFSSIALIVNFNHELSKERVSEIEASFAVNRSSKPTIFIATPFDNVVSQFTRGHDFVNSPQMVLVLKSLAPRARDILVAQLVSPWEGDVKELFKHSLSSYQIVIEIYPHTLKAQAEQIKIESQNKKKLKLKRSELRKRNKLNQLREVKDFNFLMPIVDFDVVKRYLEALQEAYGHIALFCTDPHVGHYIGVRFNPSVFASRKFSLKKIANVNSFVMSDSSSARGDCNEGASLEINVEAIVEDFKLLGKGIVKEVLLNEELLG